MEAMIAHAKVELEWMELEEEARSVEKELKVAKENLRKVSLYCQRKGQEELRARAKARKLRSSCTERTSLRDEATEWLGLCEVQMAKCRKTSLRVNRDTKVMDTRSIAGVYQRFETNLLHQELHTHYFRTLAKIISNRAELIATERRQMLLLEMTRRNDAATIVRKRDLDRTWRKRARSDLMRLRRSELGKKIFGREQNRVIGLVFRGWVRYWYWHLGHKEAFELKYAVIKQGVDLRRFHPKILGATLPRRPPRDDDVPPLDDVSSVFDARPPVAPESPPPSTARRSEAGSAATDPLSARRSEGDDETVALAIAKAAAEDAANGILGRTDKIIDGNRKVAEDRAAAALIPPSPRAARDLEVAKALRALRSEPKAQAELLAEPRTKYDATARRFLHRPSRGRHESSNAAKISRNGAREIGGRRPRRYPKTHAERLRERVVICKVCGATYTEAHNTSSSCGYHPGAYPAGVRRLSLSAIRSPFGLILAPLECGRRPRFDAGEASTNARRFL